jgi:hypothetical protein
MKIQRTRGIWQMQLLIPKSPVYVASAVQIAEQIMKNQEKCVL